MTYKIKYPKDSHLSMIQKKSVVGLFVVISILFFISLVSSQTQQKCIDLGLSISSNLKDVLQQNSNYFLSATVLNSSNGIIVTNSATTCSIQLFNSSGQAVFLSQLNFNATTNYFYTVIPSSSLLAAGSFSSNLICISSDVSGFCQQEFLVSPSGDELTGVQIVIYLIIFALLLAIILFCVLKLSAQNTAGVNVTLFLSAYLCSLVLINSVYYLLALYLPQFQFLTNTVYWVPFILILLFFIAIIASIWYLIIHYMNAAVEKNLDAIGYSPEEISKRMKKR